MQGLKDIDCCFLGQILDYPTHINRSKDLEDKSATCLKEAKQENPQQVQSGCWLGCLQGLHQSQCSGPQLLLPAEL